MKRYRLETSDASYELELTRGAYAVLRDVSRRVTASRPQIGDRPLFEVPTDEWNGRALRVGALEIGPLVRVKAC